LTWTGILCIIGDMDERTSPQAGPLMIGALVAIIDQDLRRRVTAVLHASGFPDYRSTYRSIFMWTRAEGSRITELAELAQVTQQSMSELVAELERRGYVERIPDPMDRRAVLVRRTERGWQVNAISRQAVAEAQAEWEAQLGAPEYAHLLAALRHIVTLIAPPTTGVAGHPRTFKSSAESTASMTGATLSFDAPSARGDIRKGKRGKQGEHDTSADRPDKERESL
jgi:DNA-binding MarR family transcriptional regulator